MLPIEAVRASSELIRPLARRLLPRWAARFLRALGISLGQLSRTAQAKLPEPVVICIKLALAWVVIPLIIMLFILAPGLAKIALGAIFATAAGKAMEKRK